MPKSTKAPPPQQSSLQEMWGKKKDPKPVASKPEPSAMEVDIPEEKEGECNNQRLATCHLTITLQPLLQLRSGRRVQPHNQVRAFITIHANFESTYDVLDSPRLKKRKIIESDDEEDPNDAPPGTAPFRNSNAAINPVNKLLYSILADWKKSPQFIGGESLIIPFTNCIFSSPAAPTRETERKTNSRHRETRRRQRRIREVFKRR